MDGTLIYDYGTEVVNLNWLSYDESGLYIDATELGSYQIEITWLYDNDYDFSQEFKSSFTLEVTPVPVDPVPVEPNDAVCQPTLKLTESDITGYNYTIRSRMEPIQFEIIREPPCTTELSTIEVSVNG